jgi:hypothetical protein
MTPSQVFSLCNTLVLPGWLLLIIAPRWKWTERIITGIIITFLAATYCFFIFKSFKPGSFESFGSLAGVMQLFTNEEATLAGWIHYLAFDLMIGLFEVKNAQKHKLNHLFIIPCVMVTFMLGPVGLLLYFMLRAIKTRNYFAANF